jgi:hypothetical protein
MKHIIVIPELAQRLGVDATTAVAREVGGLSWSEEMAPAICGCQSAVPPNGCDRDRHTARLRGRYVGAILHRGPEGFEAVADDGASNGCYPSQKEAAAVLQQRALHDCVGCGGLIWQAGQTDSCQ